MNPRKLTRGCACAGGALQLLQVRDGYLQPCMVSHSQPWIWGWLSPDIRHGDTRRCAQLRGICNCTWTSHAFRNHRKRRRQQIFRCMNGAHALHFCVREANHLRQVRVEDAVYLRLCTEPMMKQARKS